MGLGSLQTDDMRIKDLQAELSSNGNSIELMTPVGVFLFAREYISLGFRGCRDMAISSRHLIPRYIMTSALSFLIVKAEAH